MFGFCECGGMLMPTPNNILKCRKCGKEKQSQAENKKTAKITSEKREQEEMAIIEHDESSLPTMEKDCQKCENKQVWYWMIQTRASDEPPTRFFKCTKCKYTWREYS